MKDIYYEIICKHCSSEQQRKPYFMSYVVPLSVMM